MKKSVPAFLVSILLLCSTLLSVIPIIQVAEAEGNGPRSDLRINFYGNVSEAYAALKNGDVDFLDWPLNSTYLQDAENDLNLSVAGGIGYGMGELDINNNYTIVDQPGVQSPTHEVAFRQAIACVVDKDYVIDEIVAEHGVRIDQPCHALASSWMNETYLGEGYPYKYNLTEAAQLLDGLGFVDTDENGWRNYPSDWPGAPDADFTEHPLKVCIRIEDERLEAGRYLVTQLESLGVKCNKIETNRSDAFYTILENRSYHIYTGSWSLPKLPNHLPLLYHSDYWEPWNYNYVTGMNQTNQPNYPELDRLLEELHNATSFEDAKAPCKKALGFFVEKCINIPLWTRREFYAYRKDVHGVVSLLGANVLNKYTLLNAYKDDATPIRIGSPNSPNQLNILHSSWYTEYQVLDMIYDRLTYLQLYDPLDDQPWLAKSWEIDTWHDIETNENKSKFTFHLRNDSYWIKPVTGEVIGQFTAEDYVFSLWYSYQSPDSWHYSKVEDVHHVKLIDNYTVEVYMNAPSIWTFSGLTYPVLPMQAWTSFTQLTELRTEVFVEGVNATTPGYLNLTHQDVGAPVAINSVKANETELVEYVDYDMEMGKLKILNDLPIDTNITATFWARNNSQGFYPGDLQWQDILVGNGLFYVTESIPEADGYVQFKANPNYFLSPTTLNRDVAVLNATPSRTLLEYGEHVSVEVSIQNQGNTTENFKVELYVNATLVDAKQVYNLLPNASKALTFEWNTIGFQLGNYTVKAEAETLFGETDISDNSFTDGEIAIIRPSGIHVYLEPYKDTITLGVPLKMDVVTSNALNLYGFEIELRYNTTLLNAINATEESFLKQGGTTFIFTNETNDAVGYVKFAISLLGAENGVSGNGTLFSVNFNSSLSATGTSSVTFNISKLSDPEGQPIDHYSFNSSVRIVEVDKRSFPAVKNQTTHMIVTISNSTIRQLEYSEDESRISLNSTGPSGHSSFCNITLPKELLNGTFAVLVNGEAVHYEKIENETHHTLLFNFTHSTVKIDIILTLRGDLNGDRTVNIFDVVTISTAFGSEPGDPHWNPIADIVRDDKIDIYDGVVVCHQYGNTWTQ